MLECDIVRNYSGRLVKPKREWSDLQTAWTDTICSRERDGSGFVFLPGAGIAVVMQVRDATLRLIPSQSLVRGQHSRSDPYVHIHRDCAGLSRI